MLKNSKSWDSLTNILAHDDQSQKDSSSLGQHSIKMALQQMPETMDIIAMNKGEDTNYDNGMTNSGNYDDRTSETVSLLTLNEDEDDDGPSTGVKWPPLKEHKKVILYPWTGLSRRPSFFKKMTKASKEERKPLITNAKKAESYEDKTEDACPRVNHDKMSKLNHKMENFMRRSKCAVKEVVLCPVVGDLVENKNGPEWAEEVDVQPYFMQTMVELSEQLQMEEKSQLKNDTRYLDVWPIAEQNQAAQVLLGLENRRCPIAAEIAQLQLQIKLLEPEQGHMRNQPYLAHEEEESVGPQAVDHLENPSTYLPLSQESTSYACPVQDIPPYSYKRAPSLTLIPSSSQAGGITGTLGSKCSSTDPFTTEITAVKNRQDLLEKQFLHLSSGYYSDYNNIMEFLRAQHLRYSELLVNMNDLQEQQHSEIGNMKEVIFFMEEKMSYHSCERDRDIWEELVLFHSRLSNIEAEQKNNPASVNGLQIVYNKVINLIPSGVTNTCRSLYDKFMMNCFPVMVTILLICLSAVFIQGTPFTTDPLYAIITLILVVLLHSDPHNWSTMSAALQRSWVVTQAMRLFNRLMNEYNIVIEEALELCFGV